MSKLENLHLALLFKLSGSARVQQFDVVSPTTVCLLFFTVYVVFSPQIGSHTSNISNLSVPAHQLYIPVCWKYIFPPCAISSLRKSRLWCLRSVGRCVRRPVNLQQSQKSSYFFPAEPATLSQEQLEYDALHDHAPENHNGKFSYSGFVSIKPKIVKIEKYKEKICLMERCLAEKTEDTFLTKMT